MACRDETLATRQGIHLRRDMFLSVIPQQRGIWSVRTRFLAAEE